jgi:hypothetical protein
MEFPRRIEGLGKVFHVDPIFLGHMLHPAMVQGYLLPESIPRNVIRKIMGML